MHQRKPPYLLRNATYIDTHHTPSTQLLIRMFAYLRYPTQLYGKVPHLQLANKAQMSSRKYPSHSKTHHAPPATHI